MNFIIKTDLSVARIIDGRFDIPLECELQVGDNRHLIYANLNKPIGWDLFATLNSAFNLQPALPEGALLIDQAGFFQCNTGPGKLASAFPAAPVPASIMNQSLAQKNAVCFWLELSIDTSGLFSKVIDIGYSANGQDGSKLALVGELQSGVQNGQAIRQCKYLLSLPNIRLVDIFEFNRLVIEYQFEQNRRFKISGQIKLSLFDQPFCFDGFVESYATHFTCAMESIGPLTIPSPFSSAMPGISFKDLVFNANYIYKTTNPSTPAQGIYQISVKTELASLEFTGALLLNNSTPVMALIEIDKGLTISQLVNQCVGANAWPTSLVDINFLKGSTLYYQDENTTPAKLQLLSRDSGDIAPDTGLASLSYKQGFHLYSKFVLTLITDICFEGNIAIQPGGVSGSIIKVGSIDLWVVQLVGLTRPGKPPLDGPMLTFDSAKKSMGLACGLKFFQTDFGLNSTVTVETVTVEKDQGKQTKVCGTLAADKPIEPFFPSPPSLGFSYDKTNGFRVTNWKDFDLAKYYIDFAKEIEKLVSSPKGACAALADKLVNGGLLSTKFSISPSFSTSGDQLTLDLCGSYALSCAGKEFLTLDFPKPLPLSIQTHWSFHELLQEIETLITNSAKAFIDALLANDEAIAKFIGIVAAKQAAKYAAALACREAISAAAETAAEAVGAAAAEAAGTAAGVAAGVAAGLAAAGSLFCCFVGGTQIHMADGSRRRIENVAVGDRVLGRDGEINTVTHIYRPLLGTRKLYAINAGEPFFTAEHPFFTRAGLKSVDPVASLSENRKLSVGQLEEGDQLLTRGGGWLPLKRLDAREADAQTPLFNLALSAGHSYIANDFVVHNKGGGGGGGGGGEPGPAAPASVSAVFSAAKNDIVVSWADPNDADTSFTIWLKIPGQSAINTQDIPAKQFSIDLPVENNYPAGKYSVYVIAHKNQQTASSGPFDLTRLAPPTITPGSLVYVPGPDRRTFNVAWTAPADNDGFGFRLVTTTGAVIYIRNDIEKDSTKLTDKFPVDAPAGVWHAEMMTNSADDTHITSPWGPSSNQTLTRLTAPVVSALTFEPGDPGPAGNAIAQWKNISGNDGYEFRILNAAGDAVGDPTVTAKDATSGLVELPADLTAGVYTAEVFAQSRDQGPTASSAWSAPSVATLTKLAAPLSLSAAQASPGGPVAATWNNVADSQGYRFELLKPDGKIEGSAITTKPNENKASAQLTASAPSGTYTARVESLAGGAAFIGSDWSPSIDVKVQVPPPSGDGFVDYVVLFPKGSETAVSLSRDAPGPVPCPSGAIISPFGTFPEPQSGTKRAIRLKAVYFDGNATGHNHIEILFKMFSGGEVRFVLPQVASGEGASNFHYSDWYAPDTIDTSYAHAFAEFKSQAPYNNSAGVYSLIIEAHDLPL